MQLRGGQEQNTNTGVCGVHCGSCEVVAFSTGWKVDSRKDFYTSEKSSYSSIPMPWILGRYVDLVVLETFLTDPEAHRV